MTKLDFQISEQNWPLQVSISNWIIYNPIYYQWNLPEDDEQSLRLRVTCFDSTSSSFWEGVSCCSSWRWSCWGNSSSSSPSLAVSKPSEGSLLVAVEEEEGFGGFISLWHSFSPSSSFISIAVGGEGFRDFDRVAVDCVFFGKWKFYIWMNTYRSLHTPRVSRMLFFPSFSWAGIGSVGRTEIRLKVR